MMTYLKKITYILSVLIGFYWPLTALSAHLTVKIYMTQTQGVSKSCGTVLITETPYGLILTPDLYGLPPGLHGFHIHEKSSCAHHGTAAGGHYDPEHRGRHLGPYNPEGHQGDLPPLYVMPNGTATLPILAPRLKQIEMIKHKTLMIHQGGDNFADVPLAVGGGGTRIACGTIHD